MSNYYPYIVITFQPFTYVRSVQFSWTKCCYRFSPDFVDINNLLYRSKHSQLISSGKYMQINIPNTIHILYSYTYLYIVSNIVTHKLVVIQCLVLLIVLIETHTEEKELCIAIRNGEKPCKYNNFRMVIYGDRHITMHTGENPFKCKYCGMVKYGGRHITMHTGEKPFKGKNCGMQKYRGRHISMHAGENPFKCNKCGMVKYDCVNITMDTREHLFKYNKFGWGKYANMLMAIHIGEKPIKCNIKNIMYAYIFIHGIAQKSIFTLKWL